MDIYEIRKDIANFGYNVFFSAKLNFATYDILTFINQYVPFFIFVSSLLLLLNDCYKILPDFFNKIVFVLLILIISLIQMLVSFVNVRQYYTAGTELLQIRNKIKDNFNYLNVNNINVIYTNVNNLRKEYHKLCLPNHIPFISNIFAHYKLFVQSKQEADWFIKELNLGIWDKIPFLKLIIIICFIFIIVFPYLYI